MSRSRSRSRKPRTGRLWQTVLLLVLIGGAYWYQQKYGGGGNSSMLPGTPDPIGKVNGYDQLEGCRLVDHRNNDGDSFFVRHGDREFELRLYYVDSAEKYLSDRHESQRRRVAEQARDFGGIGIDETVALGRRAKSHTLGLLGGKTFTVYTKWERVFDGERYYGFVRLPGSDEFLGEALVEQGLVRIHTRGDTTPKGVSFHRHRDHLRALERKAKAAGRGAWGVRDLR